MIAGGLRAIITCIDPRQLEPAFVSRNLDDRFLADLPPGVDPCGERGEFHTCATAGPMFAAPIPVAPGEVVRREEFVRKEFFAAHRNRSVE
jgi:diphthamide synthase (EF-2-diphthine--ammonia ligase)